VPRLFSTCLQLTTCLLLLATPLAAELTLPAMFSDSMVMQRDQPVKVWGWAAPGQEVQVGIGDQKKTATADADGRWVTQLDALPAGGPHAMTITGDDRTLTVNDILVGEVWLCSGQSNMAMTVSRSNNPQAEAAAATHPQIRMFTVGSGHSLELQETCSGTWTVCSPETVGGFSATAYFFGRRLHKELNVPIGLINSSVGGTSVESWTSLPAQSAVASIKPRLDAWKAEDDAFDEAAATARYEKALTAWKEKLASRKSSDANKAQAAPKKPQMASRPSNDRNYPANLFNGKINPLVGYTIKGAIWYQGENSSGRGFSHLYGDQLATLVNDWRERWGQGNFPFGWVQLPNFRNPQTQPSQTDGWVLVQEGMLKTLSLPHTGMAVTIDVGEAKDIHPKDKQSVGHRMAQWALADVYQQDVIAMGPIYAASKIDGDQVVIEFDYATGLHAKNDDLKGFAIAGADRKFVSATAKIDGDRVIVSSPNISQPVSVRYAWAANPVFSLYNAAEIPASPFRTDNWEERGR